MKIQFVAILLLLGLAVGCGSNKSQEKENSEIEHIENSEAELIASNNEALEELQNRKVSVALEFLNQYIARPLGDEEYHSELMLWLENNGMTTSEFRETLDLLLTQAYEDDSELGLGYDPIIMGQDHAESYELNYYDAENNVFLLRGKGEESQFEAKIRVIEIDGRLLVDACGEINF